MKEHKKLVILDRDGVINVDSEDYIRSPDEWIPIPGSLEAIAKLNKAGFDVVVATNQSGLSRGFFDMATLNAIHKKMHQAVEEVNGRIEAIFFCPHVDDDDCRCRKPKPGMFEDICARFDVAPEKIVAVGDSARDFIAATTAGCRAVLVSTGNGRKALESGSIPPDAKMFDDLLNFADKMATQCEH